MGCFSFKGELVERNGRWECGSCGREWSAMIGDNEVPEKCPDCTCPNCGEPMKTVMVDTDGTNLEEGLECPNCK